MPTKKPTTPLTLAGKLQALWARIHWPPVAFVVAIIGGIYLLPSEKLDKIINHDWTSTVGVAVTVLGALGLASTHSVVKDSPPPPGDAQ